jgi:4-hydroxy-tetrahydrodipicolinate reductase
MDRIKVMVNGTPGNMAANVTRQLLQDDRFEVIPCSLTGPEITAVEHRVDGTVIRLFRPQDRDTAISEIKARQGRFICVDYTHPSGVNSNAEFYCKNELPFVMGTTGGDRGRLADTVAASAIAAVIAPNMAKQIVGFQAMMEYAAQTFPDLFKGYSLEIAESHQKGKADTSGTAKAMVRYFNQLGCDFSEKDIIMHRDPKVQKSVLGVPDEYLSGHGWHTYTLISGDGTVQFSFTHNVNGREVYVKGTIDAVLYLAGKLRQGVRGRVFNMIDVLKNL